MKNVRLDKLLAVLGGGCKTSLSEQSQKSILLNDVFLDSRKVTPGSLFVALPSFVDSGAYYIDEAKLQGAAAVIVETNDFEAVKKSNNNIHLIGVSGLRDHLGKIAQLFYPNKPDLIYAVTGTNGKSSVVDFLRQFWEGLGIQGASIGTMGVTFGGEILSSGLTTMDSVSLHKELDRLARKGVTHVAMEASSHGLHQHRLSGILADVTAFTNITHEHLDYHKTFENYLDAKLLLFKKYTKKGSSAVVNVDGEHFNKIKSACRDQHIVTYGENKSDFQIIDIIAAGDVQHLTVNVYGQEYEFTLPIAGHFQAYNVVCAMAMILSAEEFEKRQTLFQKLIKVASNLKPVKGRLERVGSYNNGSIYIDFAHTPDSLSMVLNSLKNQLSGDLHVVFGCGGNRDTLKRKLMGEISDKVADYVIITDDNPRNEEPAVIRKMIMNYCPKAIEIGDRREAIKKAILQLMPGDVLVIAGKGHETGQIYGDKVMPFSDHAVVGEILGE
tara:strand:- start:19304 stop:20797 length:1494 start_codon:yes stop_codon:yes gene_type:complete